MKRKNHWLLLPAALLAAALLFAHCNGTARLIRAIEAEDAAAVQTLLTQGVDPNRPEAPPSRLWTLLEYTPRLPLSVACRTGNKEIVQLLIDAGATAADQEGTEWSPLRETLWYYHPDDVDIVPLLLANGADPDFAEDELPVFVAAGMIPKVYDPLKKNGTVFASDYHEKTAQGITQIVFLLLGDHSVDSTTASGETLLILAAQAENIFLSQQLIAAGCSVNAADRTGKTALDYALETGNQTMISVLQAAK